MNGTKSVRVTVFASKDRPYIQEDPVLSALSLWYDILQLDEDNHYRGSYKKGLGRLTFNNLIKTLNMTKGLTKKFGKLSFTGSGSLVSRGETEQNAYLVEVEANYIIISKDEGKTAFKKQ